MAAPQNLGAILIEDREIKVTMAVDQVHG